MNKTLNNTDMKRLVMRERIVRAVAGALVLASLILANYISTHWLWLTAFVGFNLLQSSFTRFCPLEKILNGLGVRDKDQTDEKHIER